MDSSRVAMLRDVLAGTGWVQRTTEFGRFLRRSTRAPGELLLVGTPGTEPWHLAAHLDDEATFTGAPELSPTLVRWQPPSEAPRHLRVGLERLEQARRGETVFVVAEEDAPAALLERVHDARHVGATILSLNAGDAELAELAHEALVVPPLDVTVSASAVQDVPATPIGAIDDKLFSGAAAPALSFDTAQHFVSMAAGEAANRLSARDKARHRWARLLDAVTGPAAQHW
jgi:hypothetical protein